MMQMDIVEFMSFISSKFENVIIKFALGTYLR